MSEVLTDKELERERRYATSGWESTAHTTLLLLDTITHYKALAERRKKALEAVIEYLPDDNSAMHHFWRGWLPRARAAIEEEVR